MGIFDKFKIGFQKSASAFSSGLKEIIIKKEIDDENLNKIEEFYPVNTICTLPCPVLLTLLVLFASALL